MIWALAGLGADYSTYNAGYTPAQRDAPVRPTTLVERTGTPTFKIPENAYVPPVEVPQQTETPWALVGLVVLGLGVAYASYKSDEARFEPNRKGRRGRGKPSDKVRVMIGSEHGPRSRVSTARLRAEAKKAYAAVSSVGAKKKKMKVWPSSTARGGKSGHWGVFAVIRREEMDELEKKLRMSLKTPHAVNYLRMRRS